MYISVSWAPALWLICSALADAPALSTIPYTTVWTSDSYGGANVNAMIPFVSILVE